MQFKSWNWRTFKKAKNEEREEEGQEGDETPTLGHKANWNLHWWNAPLSQNSTENQDSRKWNKIKERERKWDFMELESSPTSWAIFWMYLEKETA